MNKWVVIVGILVLIGLGFLVFSDVTGNVVTGAAVEKMDEEYFRISEFGVDLNEEVEVKNGEDNGRSE